MESEFLKLIDQKKWRVIQEYFAEVIGAGVRVVEPSGAPITALSNPPKYCIEIISASPKAFPICKDCLLLSPQPFSEDKLIKEKHILIILI